MNKQKIKKLLAEFKLLEAVAAMKKHGLNFSKLESRVILLNAQQNEKVKEQRQFNGVEYNKWQYEVGQVIDGLTAILDKEL